MRLCNDQIMINVMTCI